MFTWLPSPSPGLIRAHDSYRKRLDIHSPYRPCIIFPQDWLPPDAVQIYLLHTLEKGIQQTPREDKNHPQEGRVVEIAVANVFNAPWPRFGRERC